MSTWVVTDTRLLNISNDVAFSGFCLYLLGLCWIAIRDIKKINNQTDIYICNEILI